MYDIYGSVGRIKCTVVVEGMKLYANRSDTFGEQSPNKGTELLGTNNARPRLEGSASKYFDRGYSPTLDELNDMAAIMKDLQINSEVSSNSNHIFMLTKGSCALTSHSLLLARPNG